MVLQITGHHTLPIDIEEKPQRQNSYPVFLGRVVDSGIPRGDMRMGLTLDCSLFEGRVSAKLILVLPMAPLWRSSI